MTEVPQFKVYGEDDPMFSERIQPRLDIRSWSELSTDEKNVIYENLSINFFRYGTLNAGVVNLINKLNHKFTRIQPGINVHNVNVAEGHLASHNHLYVAAHKDFYNIFIYEQSENLVLLMLSEYAKCLIDKRGLNLAKIETNSEERKQRVELAYELFD